MSLARALTTRLRRHGPSHSASPAVSKDDHSVIRRMASVLDRSKISGPVELISSTNALSYEAPDVATIRQQRDVASSAASTTSSSADDSDASSNGNNPRASHDLTDASSIEASPCEPNYLSCYFEAARAESKPEGLTTLLRRSASSATPASKPGPKSDSLAAPAIPRRALSHSKSSHIALARKRSQQSMASHPRHSAAPTLSRPASQLGAESPAPSAPATPSPTAEHFHHPFSRELEQLTEVVEELGGFVRDAEADDDVAVMARDGLAKWSADDYLAELCPLYAGGDPAASDYPDGAAPAWI